MADEVWSIREDGYLNLEIDCSSITYHPNLNVVLLLSKSCEVIVIDVNSGLLLQRSYLSVNHDGRLQATYLPGLDKILFVDERGIGVRTDYNGVLLLDTILQTPVSKPDDTVRLELLLSEASLLVQTLRSTELPGVEQTNDVCLALTNQITQAHSKKKKGIKAQKWNTICVELPHCYLKWVCSGLVAELKRQNRHVPALAIASAVNERLNSLLPTNSEGQTVDRSLMFSEAMRRQTFSKWPHMNYKWALPDQMAQAGFYHQPNSSGDDRAMCFTCIVCLVCWEPTDEPWSEHERHSPSCPFVKGDYTQNVPLSVSYATAPAIQTDSPMDILGTSSVPELIPTASPHGNITVWNCSRQLKREATISIVNKSTIYSDIIKKKEAWVDQDVVEIPISDTTLENLMSVWSNHEVQLGAVSVVAGAGSDTRPVVVAGVRLAYNDQSVSPLVRAMNDVNQASSALAVDIMKVAESKPLEWQLHLVVYDFHYHMNTAAGGTNDGENVSKALVSGTGTSASRQENSNMYPDIFLSKFLYTGPVLQDADSGDVVYQAQEILVGENFSAPSSSGMNCPVPLGVAVPTAGGGTFDTSMTINEDLSNFPSTSNGSPPLVPKMLERNSKTDTVSEISSVNKHGGLLSQEPLFIQSVIVDTSDNDLLISGLYPTKDGNHLLVSLKSASLENPCGMLLLYKLNFSSSVVMIVETPVCVKNIEQDLVSLTLLPLEIDFEEHQLGLAAAVSSDGQLLLIDIASLDNKARASHQDGSKFVSVSYCNSLERICAASEKGSLHFFTLHDEDICKPDENMFGENMDSNFYSQRQSSPRENPLLVNAPTLDLSTLHELTQFENLVPCFGATVPACWVELMQAQKQRKHPQHLQHADDVHHTRSWRLQTDHSSWDEHVFELTLPRSVCVGHVDVKFSLCSQCHYTPNIQLTLLKQNAFGIGKLSDRTEVDSSIDFSVTSESSKKGSSVNPVTSEQFARTHNTEILCGPINLASCLDLSNQSGTVIFSSPRLFKVRGRTLLVHIKALTNSTESGNHEDQERNAGRSKFGLVGAFWESNGLFSPGSTVDRLASTVANKKMELSGCDWLHEISITVRKAKQVEIPNERIERCAMLESDTLVKRLLDIVSSSSESAVQQNTAFDILIWLAAIRLGRVRPVPPQLGQFTAVVLDNLKPLIKSCFVKGNRTLARKCAKFIVLCSDGMKNAEEGVKSSSQFDASVVRVLLETMQKIPQAWSAGALRWYFSLLSRLVSFDTVATVVHKALSLLRQVAKNLHSRQNQNHLLLQSRFGLYGIPFEAELFDQEPPTPAKFSSTPLAYTSVLSNEAAHLWTGGTPNPPENKTVSSHGQLRLLTANHHMKGLLEVQPLHFTCHATSDGTKLEKIDSGGAGGPLVNYFEAPPISPKSPILPEKVSNNGPKNIVENDCDPMPWQQLVMSPPQHMLVVERMHSGARRFVVLDLGVPVLLTDLFIPACPDLLSLSVDLWTVSEEQDGQRLVVAPDITTKSLIMNDIHPPPIVRFIKITTIGRYGMNTTKCKIPIGCFYGHLLILPGEANADKKDSNLKNPSFQTHLDVLNVLYEDIQCRYSLACSKLQDLLSPLLASEVASSSNMNRYSRRTNELLKPTTARITSAYQECILYKRHLNSVLSVMRRLGTHKEAAEPKASLATASTDKLRVLGECLLDLMLYLVYDIRSIPRNAVYSLYQSFDQHLCEQLFHWLCVAEDTRMQLSACTLLVRMCGLQPWWGDFLVSTLTKLYSSHQTNIFPQDRVFILLVYLGRKSLWGGASRDTVIDSVLKTLLQQLTPLANSDSDPTLGFLRSHMDLPLIGWLLLFLSQCLDSSGPNSDDTQEKTKTGKDSHVSRWDFMQGELSMQRRMSAVGRCSASQGYRRKLQKKLMHHKQQLEDLEVAKKAFQASTQALSALSSQAAKLSYKLETALKQQEQFFKKNAKQQASSSKLKKETSESRRAPDARGSSSASNVRPSENALILPRTHCLPVARALIALLLHMDFTCNLDTFLLTCKVLARVALWTRPSLVLGEVVSQDQLGRLVRLAVCSRQRSPWACHAITCLLQDMLQGGAYNKRASSEPSLIKEESEQDLTKEEEPEISSITNDDEDDVITIPFSECDDSASADMPAIKIKINSNSPLPSLLESDDSELEDLLDDILERGRNLTKKPTVIRVPLGIASTVSTALDSRLEYGVDFSAEVAVRRMTTHGAYNLPMSVGAPIAGPLAHQSSGTNHYTPSRWEDSLTSPWKTQAQQSLPSSVDMLKTCFHEIFLDLTLKESTCNLELVLQLWLTLNLDNPLSPSDSRAFDASIVPYVALSSPAITALISVLACRAGTSVRCWCLAFQTLTLISNLPSDRSDTSLDAVLQRNARVIVNAPDFPKLLLAFFSSSQIKGCSGVSVCQCLQEMIVRLEMRCDVVSGLSQLGCHFKQLLLGVFDQLVQPGGAIALQQGPLDAQAKLIQLMLHLDFTNTDVNIAVNILKSVSLLVYSFMMSRENMGWHSMPESRLNFGPAGGKGRPMSWDQLVVSVVRFSTSLVQVPLEPSAGEASQTDEHKAATRLPCVADMVVRQERTMHCLLSALGLSGPCTLTDVQEPLSVGQAVFQLLSTLAHKVTLPKLILKPVFDYISGNAGSISEPLLSLLRRLIEQPEALHELSSLGALDIVCENLLRANHGLISCQPSRVSVVMQKLNQAHSLLLPHSASAAATSKKACDLDSGMFNFAPLGRISSSNPTAQPADVLIQSSPPHKRARAPAWSYHFYPEESWVELTLTLPCAVLLKEVHLQPHLTSLATCPSGVGIEVSRDGRSPLVPVSLPLDSSGLTFIQMQLPKPEVVTTVLLRLYKPRDSSNIGLSQIRLLGNTTFNDYNAADTSLDGDETALDTSTVLWVRLLYHCMTVCPEPVVASITRAPGLLQACCGLLLVPAPPLLTPCLEHVLYVLATNRPELGLNVITTLLTIGSNHFYNGGVLNGASSVVDLLFMLCTTHDSHSSERLTAILSWLQQSASQAHPSTSSTYVQCVAAILWDNPALHHMLTEDLFRLVYQWTLKLEPRCALKRAVDSVLCSMCYVNPMLFPTLLQEMGALVPISATKYDESISDDRKDGGTDDSKKEEQEMSEWYNQLVLQDLQQLKLSESQLMTIAVACQSPPATLQLLSSGLPDLLSSAIVEFCTKKHTDKKSKLTCQSRLTDSDKASGRNHIIKGSSPMVQLQVISYILNFFAEVSSEGIMRDWLGSSKGFEFWLPLLTVLCNRTSNNSRCQTLSESLTTLESATVKFLSRCCWAHPTNQRLLGNVLCEVISQQSNRGEVGISGVTRRLVLQLLLESEKVPVCVRTVSSAEGPRSCGLIHPRHGTRRNKHMLYLSVHTTCADIIKLLTDGGGGSEKKPHEMSPVDILRAEWLELSSGFQSTTAAMRAKRIKDAKNMAASMFKDKFCAKKSNTSSSVLEMVSSTERLRLQHAELPDVYLPPGFSLSQLLTILDHRDVSLSTPCLQLTLIEAPAKEASELLLATPPFPSPLQVFTQQGGLALLAEHLPIVYPETLLYFRSNNGPAPAPVTAADQVDADWVKVEANDDIYEDVEESMVAPYMSNQNAGAAKHTETTVPSVPVHSLTAFGLFLRLPGYADVLLKDKLKAQCLLRLALGVSDDGEGGDIVNNPVCSALPTLPFEVLRQLLELTPLSTDDGVLLRRTALDHGVLHLLLGCLSVFSHQPTPHADAYTARIHKCMQSRNKSDDKSHLYWAKGTGFGTGSTAQSWNVEQALSQQRSEEQHVTILLQVLSSYINPGGLVSSDSSDDDSDSPTKPSPQPLPSCIHDLLQQSCLLPVLSSYLRNDSVLDMARHIPLYRSVLQLLRAIAQNIQLVSLLLPKPKQNSFQLSAVCLLLKMKMVVDTYASRLKINKPKSQKKAVRASSIKQHDDNLESDEGLALLIPDIQETANLVQSATDRLVYESESDSENGHSHLVELSDRKTLEQRYLEVMKPLQFETFEMITELSDGNGFQFVVSYHFESNVRAGGDRSHPARVKRLAQETVTLSTSLPLSFSSSVFVRCDADRLDIMKVLITGPAETPYSNGCFELDVYFPPDYPNSPMLINLETTGQHTIRFNPNLYNDGKVCLSVLNTWHGRPEEKWNAQTSSFLQVLVSIQSLILVPEPYFNEPGYERSRGTQAGNQSSREYNSNICQATVKWAMLEQLRNPSPCFKQVIQTHFWMKRKEIKSQVEAWIADMEAQVVDRRSARTISLNIMALKRHHQQLCEELAKLKPPPGLEDLADVDQPNWQQNMEKLVSQVCE